MKDYLTQTKPTHDDPPKNETKMFVFELERISKVKGYVYARNEEEAKSNINANEYYVDEEYTKDIDIEQIREEE